jgi:hypothetical protein
MNVSRTFFISCYSYRIWDTLGDTSMLFTPNRENAICVKLIDAIRIHQKAIESVIHLRSHH